MVDGRQSTTYDGDGSLLFNGAATIASSGTYSISQFLENNELGGGFILFVGMEQAGGSTPAVHIYGLASFHRSADTGTQAFLQSSTADVIVGDSEGNFCLIEEANGHLGFLNRRSETVNVTFYVYSDTNLVDSYTP